MPWELTLCKRSSDKSEPEPLVTKDEVVAAISESIPTIQWHEDLPLIEQINSIPDHPLKELIHTWPESMRKKAEMPKLTGAVVTSEYSITFYGFENYPLTSVGIEVRGNGNPLPVLGSLCNSRNWALREDATQSFVDLDSESAAEWDQFRKYRDRVVEDAEED